jgi:hypothetical protein
VSTGIDASFGGFVRCTSFGGRGALVQIESCVHQATEGTSDVIKTGGVLIVSALAAAALGVMPASGQTGQALCSATPVTNVLTPFALLGDTTQYVQASSGLSLLTDGGTLTASCTRTPGIQSIVRFSAANLSGGTGAIHVEVLANRGTLILDGGLVTAPSTLTALDAVVIPWDRNSRGATDLQVRLTAVGGSFEIGEIYVDPYLMR